MVEPGVRLKVGDRWSDGVDVIRLGGSIVPDIIDEKVDGDDGEQDCRGASSVELALRKLVERADSHDQHNEWESPEIGLSSELLYDSGSASGFAENAE